MSYDPFTPLQMKQHRAEISQSAVEPTESALRVSIS
jgi:hypothetical protein